MLDDLTGLQCAITAEAINGDVGGDGEVISPHAMVGSWKGRNQRAIERTQQLLAELRNAPMTDVSMLSVVLRELRHLA
jgi:NAD-specific glutamate dehydrogenase